MDRWVKDVTSIDAVVPLQASSHTRVFLRWTDVFRVAACCIKKLSGIAPISSEGSTCTYSPNPILAYLNLKLALCSLPSLSLTTSCRHVPAHEFSVFQT